MSTFDTQILAYAGPRGQTTPVDRAAQQVALLCGVFAGVLVPVFLVCYGIGSLVLTGLLSTTPISKAHGVQLVAAILILIAAGYAWRTRRRWFAAGMVCGAVVSVLNSLA